MADYENFPRRPNGSPPWRDGYPAEPGQGESSRFVTPKAPAAPPPLRQNYPLAPRPGENPNSQWMDQAPPSGPAGGNKTMDLSRQIQENIRKKASSQEFQLQIADEAFHQIPDHEGNRGPSQKMAPAPRREKSQRPAPPRQSRPKEPGDGAPPRPKRRKKQGIFGSLLYAGIVVVVSIFLSVFLLQSMQDYLGLLKTGQPAIVTIPENATPRKIAAVLSENKIISQPLTFVLYATLKDKAQAVLPGEYTMNPEWSYDQMFAELDRVKENSTEVKTITILPGRTVREIGQQLEEAAICTEQEFVQALQDAYNGRTFEWMNDIPQDPDRYIPLEGYVFPDTHYLSVGSDANYVVRRFLANFNRQLPIFQEDAAKKGMTIDQVLIIASLVEREGSGHNDMMLDISSVFHNRLGAKSPFPMLQSDVTINYVENNIKTHVTDPEQVERYALAYNTYRRTGLPAGPVGNPAMEAIRAAIYPNVTSYYFFVTDTNDKFYWAAGFEEHKRNCAVADSVKDAEGKSAIGGVATEQ